MTNQNFASLFPKASHKEWREAAVTALKGKPFEVLQGQSYDGIKIEPLYERAIANPVLGRKANAPWSISQMIDLPEYQDANLQALKDLEGGASALTLQCTPRYGFATSTLKKVLEGVYLELIPIRIDGGSHKIAKELEALAKGLDTKIALGFDPISNHEAVKAFDYTLGTLFMADGREVHVKGGSEAQELAYALACAVAYLRQKNSLSFILAADADQFMTIAKFRAMRLLWARVEEAFGLTPQTIDLHAETAWRMMTKTDAAVNWLRTTVAVFSAGVGGADHITVLPRSLPLGLPNEFDRRMARNMQLVLLEESGLAAVSDPASGAGSFETLTDELCQKAWGIFQEIEAKGGIEKAYNWFFEQVSNVNDKRLKNIAKRKDPLTGTSEFANLNDIAPDVLMPANIEGRLSQVFEKLRETPQTIKLVTLGDDYAARLSFAQGFFAAGGVSFGKSNKAVLIVGTDKTYQDEALATIASLKTQGFKTIILAGKPLDEAQYRSAGMSDYIAMGRDIVEVVRNL